MARITVAVPTIDGRGKYLQACLKTCVSQTQDFEILVSDNPGGEAREIVESLGDSRVRYITPPSYLPMSAHWDYILSEATGDFISYIGDDDGLMPNCIGRVSGIIAEVGEIPIHHSLANYHWPDIFNIDRRNTTVFFHQAGWGDQLLSCDEFLTKVAAGKARYVDGPMVYHNFVPTSLLKRMSKDGVFFRRSSPDVYASVAIAANTDRFFSTNEILTLSGQGAKANGAAVQSGNGKGFIKDANQFYKSRFDSLTIQSTLLDSYIEVAEYFDKPELLSRISYAGNYVAALAEARGMKGDMRSNELKFSLANRHLPEVVIRTVASKVKSVARKLSFGAKPIPSNIEFLAGEVVKMPPGTENIYDATLALDKMLSNAFYNSAPSERSLHLRDLSRG